MIPDDLKDMIDDPPYFWLGAEAEVFAWYRDMMVAGAQVIFRGARPPDFATVTHSWTIHDSVGYWPTWN